MLKKLSALALILALTMTQAHAVSDSGLKAVFDELHYALTVEWDQKDSTFYQAQMEKFSESVKKIQAGGLTDQTLVEETLSQVKEEQLKRELRTAFTMISLNKMSSSEARDHVRNIMNKSYSQGASWRGGVVGSVLIILVIVAAVALASGQARVADDCVETYQCEDYCTAGVCYEDCGYQCI